MAHRLLRSGKDFSSRSAVSHGQPQPRQLPLALAGRMLFRSGPRVTETVAAIVAAHRAGTVSPAQTVARSFQRIRDHNDPAIFISLRDEKEAMAEAEALTAKDAGAASAVRRSRRGKGQYRRRRLAHHRRLPGLRLFAGARRDRRWRGCARPAPSSSARPISISSPPASSACARPMAFPTIRCAAISFRADRVRARRWRCRPDWCRWRWAPIPRAPAACRRCSTTSSG